MGDWIRKHLDHGSADPGLNNTEYKGMTSRQIAELFCGYAYPVRDLYKRIAEEAYSNDPNSKAHFDLAHINKMLAMYPPSETKGVNVAAKAKGPESQPPAADMTQPDGSDQVSDIDDGLDHGSDGATLAEALGEERRLASMVRKDTGSGAILLNSWPSVRLGLELYKKVTGVMPDLIGKGINFILTSKFAKWPAFWVPQATAPPGINVYLRPFCEATPYHVMHELFAIFNHFPHRINSALSSKYIPLFIKRFIYGCLRTRYQKPTDHAAAQVRGKKSNSVFVALSIATVLAMGVSVFVNDWYFWLLSASPLLTKCATALTFTSIADLIAQKIEHVNLEPAERMINKNRLVSFSLINMVLCGFVLSFWLDFIGGLGTTVTAGLIKIALQATIYTPFYYLVIFPSVVIFSKSSVREALSVRTFRDGINAIRCKFLSTYKKDLLFWTCGINIINFILLPFALQYFRIDIVFANGLIIFINGIATVFWETYLSSVSHKRPVILKAAPVVIKEISSREIRDIFSSSGSCDSLLLPQGIVGGNKIRFADFLYTLFHKFNANTHIDTTELGAGTGWFIDDVIKRMRLKEYFEIDIGGTELSNPKFPLTNEQALAKFGSGSMDMVAINAPDRDKVSDFLATADKMVKNNGVIYFAACRESTEQAFEWLLSNGYYVALVPADSIFKKGSAPSLSKTETCDYRLFASRVPQEAFGCLEGCSVYHGKSLSEDGQPDGFIHQGKASWEEFASRLDKIRKKELSQVYRKRLTLLLKDALRKLELSDDESSILMKQLAVLQKP